MTEPAQARPSPFARLGGFVGQLSPSPDWTSSRALALATVPIGLVVAVVMIVTSTNLPGFRDTDDATRLVMVRQLLSGHGWYDQVIGRVYPPHGLWMHWSRLLDGGIAAIISFFRLFMPQPQAEEWTRFIWPLLWIFPGVAAGMALIRNLGGRSAGLIGGLMLMVNVTLYRQFYPGRIDHHDVQIVMTAIALACATARADRARWAIVGGLAAAFGLAVGLEALPEQALVGASYGLALIRDREEAPATRAYGLTLAGAAASLFLIQTPPWRWSMSFCDMMALNLVAALVIAGLGLAIAGMLSARSTVWSRLALVGAAGIVAAAVYVGIEPQCIHGPFAGLDPIVKQIWLQHVQEVQPLPHLLKFDRIPAIGAIVFSATGLGAAVYLVARQWRAPSTAALLILACAILADIVGFFAWRMQDYVCWVGVPALAATFSWLAKRWLRDLMIPTVIVTLLISPVAIALAVNPIVTAILAINAKIPTKPGPGVRVIAPPPAAANRAAPANSTAPLAAAPKAAPPSRPRPKPGPGSKTPRCYAEATYRPLSLLPFGNVLAIQDLGPFILVYTNDTTVAAPYHRVWPAILLVQRTFASPPAVAESYVRAAHAGYVVDCLNYPTPASPGSLGGDLRHGQVPAWLKKISAPDAPLKIYKVLPPAGAK